MSESGPRAEKRTIRVDARAWLDRLCLLFFGNGFQGFEQFVLSLTNPANPFQHRDRILDASIQPPMLLPGVTGNAVVGQAEFLDLLRAVQRQIDESPTATTREQALVLLRDAVERLRQGPSPS